MTKSEKIRDYVKRIKEQNDYCVEQHAKYARSKEVYFSAMQVLDRLIFEFRNLVDESDNV